MASRPNQGWAAGIRSNPSSSNDKTWQPALHHLLDEADVVFMDLAGFSAPNAGCAYELGQLFNRLPLERLILVVDRTTDHDFLHQILRQSWSAMGADSPNRRAEPQTLRLYRINGSAPGFSQTEFQQKPTIRPKTLAGLLCEAAAARLG